MTINDDLLHVKGRNAFSLHYREYAFRTENVCVHICRSE